MLGIAMTVEIEIDNVKLNVPQNSMIIEAADNAGIHIPRFCYHKKLPIAANCRMCLIEVEKVGKPLPACATPVSQGMRVFTRSPRALEAQQAVMEFLLINHPLDCPICDQGGECELQDVSMGYGSDTSLFSESKRAVADENLGPLIASEMTRCIHCTRCVRFGQEIAGVRELGAINRGEHMEISTAVKHTLSSELSGNIIDLCPVGALTSKPFRFTARAWELNQHPTIAPHDAVGSHLYVHTRRGRVMRAVPRECEEVNETWISDRDRFSYLGIYSPDRLQAPWIKSHGEWHETDWSTALNLVASQLNAIVQSEGPAQIGALASPSSTLEECYLLQKLWRGLGSSNLDHRIHETDFSDQKNQPLYPGLHLNIADLEMKDAILLIGSNIHHEQPLIAHRLRKASLQGAKIIAINPMDFPLHFSTAEKITVHPNHMVHELASIIKALKRSDLPEWMNHFSGVEPNTTHVAIAEHLKTSESPYVLLGAAVLNHPNAALIHAFASYIAELIQAPQGELPVGANAAGAWLAGLVPHRAPAGKPLETVGLDAQQMLATPLKTYLLLGIEPGLDCANPRQAVSALQQSEFVVAISPFKTEHLMEVADVILPAATFAETSGTFVNGEGRWQPFKGTVAPLHEARPTWKILRVLGSLLNIEGFEYDSSEEVRRELKRLVKEVEGNPGLNSSSRSNGFSAGSKQNLSIDSIAELTRISEWPIYRADALVRRSEPLQKLPTQKQAAAYMSLKTAEKFGFSENQWVMAKQGEGSAQLSLLINSEVPEDCVFIPSGYPETAMLGENFGEITVCHV